MTCTTTGLTARVKATIVRALELPLAPEELHDDEPLLGGPLGLDSVAALEIVLAVEVEFGIEVADEDVRSDLFASVGAVCAYVAARRGESPDLERRQGG